MLGRKGFTIERTEQDILLLAVMAAVSVGPDETDDRVDFSRIHGAAGFDVLEKGFHHPDHPFDEPMFDHQGTDWHHGSSSWLYGPPEMEKNIRPCFLLLKAGVTRKKQERQRRRINFHPLY